MSLFRLEKKPGKKSLRLLVLMLLMLVMTASVLCGCGASKYDAVDLSVPEVEEVQPTTITIGGTQGTEDAAAAGNAEQSGEGSLEPEQAPLVYEEVDDYIIVTADVLNVRAADNTEARIFKQLPAGEILHRTGYHEEWCRVEYDGGVAYVATDMVQVTEKPEPEAETEETAEAETAEETAEAESTDAGLTEAGSETEFASEERSEGPEKDPEERSEDSDGIDYEQMYRKTGTVQEETVEVALNGHVVAIDAGHQAKANAEKESIGPGSQTKKAKMEEGAVGTVTGVKEYELTLEVAQMLEKVLLEQGYQVVMIRDSHDVNLSNAERSVIANNSGADILIRLHANAMDNSGVYGVMAMCMTEYNPYNSELSADSYTLSKLIVNNICSRTGTKNRGVQKVDNSGMINWCSIPVSVVEMGFLTNPDEDRWLQTDEYREKIVDGILEAVNTYFGETGAAEP